MQTRRKAIQQSQDGFVVPGVRSSSAPITESESYARWRLSAALVNRTSDEAFAKIKHLIEFVAGGRSIVQVSVDTGAPRLVHFTEPYDKFPSEHMIAQLMLVL
jgi:hypothetical protein